MVIKIVGFIKKNIFPIVLIIIEVALFLTNYKKDTFLVGWDNVFPELNLSLNLKRSIFSVWQEYRGLGIQDGMAHAANLIHTLLIFFLTYFLPRNIIRYFFIILMHLVGALGMYQLLKKLLRNNWVAFIGSLFYLFNLGTIQIFYAPLEVFAVHFASLPWLVLSALTLCENFNKKNLMIFAVLTLLASPQGFVPTIFIAYFLVLISLLVREIGFKKITIGNAVLIIMLTLCINSFWLLPFVNSAVNRGSIIKNTKINQISSDEIFLKNKARGGLIDVLTMQGFMVDTKENNQYHKYENIMTSWLKHLKSPHFAMISTIFISLMLIGLYFGLKNNTFSVFIPGFFIVFFFLGNNIPILDQINGSLRNMLPIVGEAFRFPFTKFVISYGFYFSVFFALGLKKMDEYFRHKRLIIFGVIIFLIIYALPVFRGNFFYDSLRLKIPKDYFDTIGFLNTKDENGRIMTLPQSTFWNWTYTKWGYRGSGFLWYGVKQPMLERAFDPWSNYNEQYINELLYVLQTQNQKNFIQLITKYNISWILIDSNILNQSSKPLNYDKLITLITKAFPRAEFNEFQKITLIYLGRHPDINTITNTPKTNAPSYDFKDVQYNSFGDYIATYGQPDYYYLFPSLFTNKTQKDIEFVFETKDDYISLKPKKIIPFKTNYDYMLNSGSIAGTENLIPVSIKVDEVNNLINISYLLPEIIINSVTYQPNYSDSLLFNTKSKIIGIKLNGEILSNKETKTYIFTKIPNYFIIETNDGLNEKLSYSVNPNTGIWQQDLGKNMISDITVNLPIIKNSYFSYKNLLLDDYNIKNPCFEAQDKPSNSQSIILNDSIELKAQGSSICFDTYLEKLYHSNSYFVNLNINTINGLSTRLYIENPYQKFTVIETILNNNGNQAAIIPKTEEFYQGYSLKLNSVSIGNNYISDNRISSIEVYPFFYEYLKNLKIVKKIAQINKPDVNNYSVEKTGYYSYSVRNIEKITVDTTLTLNQSFDPGWKAYRVNNEKLRVKGWLNEKLPFLFGQEIKDHVLVNNWANGWVLRQGFGPRGDPSSSTIIIVFWPQCLEYLGFIFLILTFIIIFRSPDQSEIQPDRLRKDW